MNSLNIGILAHVDAGKTSLTERLLFNAGVIKTLGSVDKGNTQTDTMTLERQRGITIKAAVTSFQIGELKINLIDTPGHPDFIAEVERALHVLDAVILVVSAVEGIQPQTRILMRTLKELRIPTLIFVNKIDRMGARGIELVKDIRTRLFSDAIAINTVVNIGTPQAKVVPIMSSSDTTNLTRKISQMEVCPLLFGSAITGAGIPELIHGLALYFKPLHIPKAPLSAIIFKIEHGNHNEKIAYIRIYSGEMHVRTSLTFHHATGDSSSAKITAMRLFKDGGTSEVKSGGSGDIVKVWGLHNAKINDYVGSPPKRATFELLPPHLEVAIRPQMHRDYPKLHNALQDISEQDPLIQLHQKEEGILVLRLYGEVQREILKALLKDAYALDAIFEQTRIIYIEKVRGIGMSYAEKFAPGNIFIATLGFCIRPGRSKSGVIFKPDAGIGRIPVSYMKIVEEAVYTTLQQGICGWEVTDCIVEVTHAGYESAMSTGTDFRRLTPLLIAEALKKAETETYEPMSHFELDTPEATLPSVLQNLAAIKAVVDMTSILEGSCHIEGYIPARLTQELIQQIPNLTNGEGLFIVKPEGYQKVYGSQPTKERTDNNPFNKEEYLRRTLRRVE